MNQLMKLPRFGLNSDKWGKIYHSNMLLLLLLGNFAFDRCNLRWLQVVAVKIPMITFFDNLFILTDVCIIHAPISITGAEVEMIESFKFLGVNITNDMLWTNHIRSYSQKSTPKPLLQQEISKFVMSPTTLRKVYRCTATSIDGLHHALVWEQLCARNWRVWI